MERVYIAIDLKSFYASVECVERHFDPLTTNLVVADSSRTEKTICLAVSPSLKAHGISGRARLFEVVQRVKEVNNKRLAAAIRSGHAHKGEDGNIDCHKSHQGYIVLPLAHLAMLPLRLVTIHNLLILFLHPPRRRLQQGLLSKRYITLRTQE